MTEVPFLGLFICVFMKVYTIIPQTEVKTTTDCLKFGVMREKGKTGCRPVSQFGSTKEETVTTL